MQEQVKEVLTSDALKEDDRKEVVTASGLLEKVANGLMRDDYQETRHPML
jgi:hypothetical protein